MKVHSLVRRQRVARPLPEVFEFFSAARNLEQITPPWLRFRLVHESTREVRAGTRLEYRLRLHGIPLRWMSMIEEWDPGRRFVDRQLNGPYRLWRHTHEFTADGDCTIVRDQVRYALPLGRLGDLAEPFVARDLDRIFAYRHDAVTRLLTAPTEAWALR
jgi:hypothetical protein